MEERGTEGMAKMPGWARALTLGNGGGGVGGIRQLVGGQRGHASGRKAPGQKVVECCQLVGSCLLTPTRTAVAEPDLCVGGVGSGEGSPQLGSWRRAETQLEQASLPLWPFLTPRPPSPSVQAASSPRRPPPPSCAGIVCRELS